MNREQLHALLTQAKDIVHHTDFVIVGSLSILGAVSDPPRTMVMSIDVDTYLKNDPQRTYELARARLSEMEQQRDELNEAITDLKAQMAWGEDMLASFRKQAAK